MFETLKDLISPIRAEDADFGSMRFLRQSGTWECMAPFQPLDRPVEVLVFGVEAGPTSSQRQKWCDLADRYQEIEPLAKSVVAEAVQRLELPSFTMQLAAVVIPEDHESAYDLELTFGHPSGPPQFDVRISSWQVAEVIGPL